MKKSNILLVLLLSLSLYGCSIFSGGTSNPLFKTPYQAGRTYVFFDTMFKSIQPEEVQKITDSVYALALVDFQDGISWTDELVKAQIDSVYNEATPEFKEVLFTVYKNCTLYLTDQIEANPDIPDAQIFEEFFRGVRDAAAIYRIEESEE